MVLEPNPATLDALLSQRHWLTSLARGLIDDPTQVDDVVQETVLVGLERPPREVAAMRTWLGRVLRQRAWLARRGARRRRRREQYAARRESVAGDEDIVERFEVAQIVARAIGRLDEPYRRTILLRYFEELTPTRIAQREGVPASTVRSRLARAHEQLERDLDHRFGGREQWFAALLPFATERASRLATFEAGARTSMELAMTKKALTLSLMAVILWCAGGAVWWGYDTFRKVDPNDAASDSLASLPATSPIESTHAPSREVTAVVDRLSPASGDAEIVSAKTTPESSTDTAKGGAIGTIRGLIWRTDGGSLEGGSLEGARVFLWSHDGEGAVVTADGTFTIQTPYADVRSVYLEFEGHRIALGHSVRPIVGDEVALEIEVEVDRDVEVEIVDRDSHDPVGDTPITVRSWNNEGQAAAIFTKTDASGHVTLPFLPPGSFKIEVKHPDYTYQERTFETPLDAPLVIELVPARPFIVTVENYEQYSECEIVSLQMFGYGDGPANGQTVIFSGRPDDRERLHFNAPVAGHWVAELFGTRDFPRASARFDVTPGDAAVELTVTLPRRGTTLVTGILRDAHGDPVTSGRVTIGEQSGDVGEDGYAVAEVRAGKVEVGYHEDGVDYPLGERTIPDRPEVELDLALAGTAQLAVRVVDLPSELLIDTVWVRLRSLSASGAASDEISGAATPDAPIVVHYLEPGRYRLLTRVVSVKGAPRLLDVRELSIVGGRLQEAVIPYRGIATVELVARLEGEAPANPHVTVSWWSPVSESRRVELIDGRATFELFHDFDGAMHVVADGFRPADVKVRARIGDVTRMPVVLQAVATPRH